MNNSANLLRALAFAVIGAIFGYFILTRITPFLHFSQNLGGIGNISIINEALGLTIFGLVNFNLKKWLPILIGGLLGAFLGTFLSIILAGLITDFIWYSIFETPTITDKVYQPVFTFLWLIFVLIGIKIALKVSKKRFSTK